MGCLIRLLEVSRNLDRIGDLATNIAEDVVYMTDGEIIRHRTEDFARSFRSKAPIMPKVGQGTRDRRRRPRVLFLCTGNSCRSQIAEGWVPPEVNG